MRKNEIAKDFRSLSGFLQNWDNNVNNPRILYKIAFNKIDDGKSIDYSILKSEPLIFNNIDIERHSIPKGIEKIPKEDIMSKVKLTAQCREKTQPSNNEDPLEGLGVSILTEITFEENNKFRNLIYSLHLDKGGDLKADYLHPEYHLNFGGIHMCEKGDVYGDLFLMPTPRIMHPPMDIILSCDFIVRNFYKRENHKKLTQNPSYINLINRAKDRFWQPYSNALASKWINSEISNLPYSVLTGHI